MSRRNSFFKSCIGRLVPAFVLFPLIMPFFSCNDSVRSREEKAFADSLKTRFDDSVKLAKEDASYDIFPVIKYKQVTINDAKQLYKILWEYRKAEGNFQKFRIFSTLNRKELRFIRPGQTVIIPDTFVGDIRAYSVFPQFYRGAKTVPKLIMVSNRYLAYACYEYGKLTRFAACNTGKETTPSYPGRYALSWRERVHRSSIDSNWVMPFTWNFHTEAGSAFHQFEMPGRPASHSCIRQFAEDAEWLFNWGKGIRRDTTGKFIPMSGTPVVIIDHFDFGSKSKSWLNLSSNKDSVLKLPPDPMAVEEALIPISQIPEMSRGTLRNKQRYMYAEDSLRARGVIRPGTKLTVSVDFNKQRRLKAVKDARRKKQMEDVH